MKVELLAADDGACGFYRMRLPAAHAGVEATVSDGLKLGWKQTPRGIELVDAVSDADVVVLQRPAKYELAAAVPLLQARGVAVVVDMDDDFTAIDPQNPAWGAGEALAINEACRMADLVTVTTPALAQRYAPHGRVAVLPNYVPASYLSVVGTHDRIGWAGSVKTHPNDLQVTRGAVANALRTAGKRFHIIGDGERVRQNLGLDHQPTITGIVPLEQYPREVATLAVGVVPLADTTFNRAKSALKLLEYAALGVAAVASPTPDNERLHAEGAGVLAHRPRDWRRALTDLLADRDEVVERGREVARANTIERNAWRWAEAWATALVNRRSA